jgi:hypothetical protein
MQTDHRGSTRWTSQLGGSTLSRQSTIAREDLTRTQIKIATAETFRSCLSGHTFCLTGHLMNRRVEKRGRQAEKDETIDRFDGAEESTMVLETDVGMAVL